jgi:hypothetical protein
MRLMIIGLILLLNTAHAGPFVDGMVGVQMRGTGQPEVDMSNEVGGWAVGYNYQHNENLSVEGGWMHWSGISSGETGYGLNPIYLKIRYEWK